MKKFLFVIAFLFLCFTFYGIGKTYGLFESNIEVPTKIALAKWQFKVNNYTLGETNNFNIDQIYWEDNSYVKENKAAPDNKGYFDILIDPTGTEVSVRYDITFDFSLIENKNFNVTSVTTTDGTTLIRTGENTYSNVFLLSDIQNNKTNTIRVNIVWTNSEDNNDADSILGLDKEATISIPISILFTQYLDEELNEYVAPVVTE